MSNTPTEPGIYWAKQNLPWKKTWHLMMKVCGPMAPETVVYGKTFPEQHSWNQEAKLLIFGPRIEPPEVSDE